MKRTLSRRGFTLIETIIAIAIVAILCGIAIPSIISTNKSLSERQEDDYAKSIFLAAQDNLTSLKTNGSLNNLRNDIPAYATVYTEDKSALKDNIAGILGDEHAQELLDGDTGRQYVYVDKTSPLFERVLPPGSIDSSILGKDITIVFNPVRGDVFFVKYGQNGEYCGSVVNLDESDRTITPVVRLVNGEENVVQISVPVPEDYQSIVSSYLNAFTFRITVSDDSGNSFTDSLSSASEDEGFDINYVTHTVSWTLDSLISGQSFADRAKGKIDAGENVSIDVDYDFATPSGGAEIRIDRSRSNASGNSIFGKLNGSTITVSNGRHLQNLNNIGETLASEIAGTAGAKVVLGCSILWGDTVEHYMSKDATFKRFTPIKASKLFADGSKVTFDGENNTIYNLYILDTNDDAGLFDNLLVSASNLTLEDPIIKGGGNAGALAATCGYVKNSAPKNTIVISNCRVVLKTDFRDRGTDAELNNILLGKSAIGANTDDIFGVCSINNNSTGLLIGAAYNATVTGSTAGGVVETGNCVMPASGANFGLVIGYAENCTIQNLTASGSVQGGICSQLGFVAGCTSGDSLTVKSSIVNGSVLNTKATNVGGAVGYADKGGSFETVNAGVSINGVPLAGNTDAYACPSGLGAVGKFAGHIEGGSFKNCSGTGTADRNYQFVGTVYYETKKLSDTLLDGTYYTSTVKNTSNSIDAEANADNLSYTSKDGSMQFIPVTDISYKVYSTISAFDNNTYTLGSETKHQYIANDSSYFYKRTSDTGLNYTLEKVTALEDDMKFIISGSGRVLTASKEIIPAGEINSRYQSGEFYRYVWEILTDADFLHFVTTNGLSDYLGLWPSENAKDNDPYSYYYSTADDKPYKPNNTSVIQTLLPSIWAKNRSNAITNTGADIYRYTVAAVPVSISEGSYTPEQFESISTCMWQWKKESGSYMLKYVGDSPTANIYLNTTKVYYGGQTNLRLLPEGTAWTDSASPLGMSYSYVEGKGVLIYRSKYISISEMKASFMMNGVSPGLMTSSSVNKFDDTCYLDIYKVTEPTRSTTFKYNMDGLSQRITSD